MIIDAELQKLSSIENQLLQAYCDGANIAFEKYQAWEFKMLLGFKDFNWTKEDTILLIRMTGFLTLAQSQGKSKDYSYRWSNKG